MNVPVGAAGRRKGRAAGAICSSAAVTPCRMSTRPSAAWPRRTSRCWSAAKAGPARNWSPGPSTSTAMRRPFLAVNCAAIPESLAGKRAVRPRKGAVHRRPASGGSASSSSAPSGTLLLDEVGDMSPVLQSKVLRVLQGQRFERVGRQPADPTDVRIIAATNRDLNKMVDGRQFPLPTSIIASADSPSICRRCATARRLAPVVDYFLTRFNREMARSPGPFPPIALDRALHYRWPGNVRELENVLKLAMVHAAGPVIITEFLPELVRLPHAAGPKSPGGDLPPRRSEGLHRQPPGDRLDQSLRRGPGVDGEVSPHPGPPRHPG